jgi:3'(2'),5'-bisphosphate nucleotidase
VQPENASYSAELDAAVAAALAAGAIIRDFYDRAAAATYAKSDGSPVTDADLAADLAIRSVLTERFPAIPILSEEGHDDAARLGSRRVWIVDPLDGTEQFIRRTGDFDVLVALIADGRPIVAASCQPTTGTLVTAVVGRGAWIRQEEETPRRIRFDPASDAPRVATSKWFGAPDNAPIVDDVAARLNVPPLPPSRTGLSPRLFVSPRPYDAVVGVRVGDDQTMASEWDFAAGDLVIHEAGGLITDLSGQPYRYNKPQPRNRGGLIAAVDPATHNRVLAAAQAARAANRRHVAQCR